MCLWKAFGIGRGVIQVDPASPIIFNIVVNVVVWSVLDVVCSTQVDVVCSIQVEQHGIEWEAWEINLVFYANDNRIEGQDHELIQDALMAMVAMFRRMRIDTNFNKTKAMECTPEFILGKWGKMTYKRQETGEGDNVRNRTGRERVAPSAV